MPRGAVLLAVTLLAPAARAENVSVQVDSSADRGRQMLATEDGRIVAACDGDCAMHVAPGRYVFSTSEIPGAPSAEATVTVNGPTMIRVTAGRNVPRVVGLSLVLAGFAGAVTGFCASLLSEHEDRSMIAVLSAVGGGAAMAVGTVLFVASATTISPRPDRVGALAPMLRVGVTF